jgi:hypothetical protein
VVVEVLIAGESLSAAFSREAAKQCDFLGRRLWAFDGVHLEGVVVVSLY